MWEPDLAKGGYIHNENLEMGMGQNYHLKLLVYNLCTSLECFIVVCNGFWRFTAANIGSVIVLENKTRQDEKPTWCYQV